MSEQVRYPWDKWFGRKRAYTLIRGVDYACMSHSMSAQVRNEAVRREVRVSVWIGVSSEGREILTIKNLGAI